MLLKYNNWLNMLFQRLGKNNGFRVFLIFFVHKKFNKKISGQHSAIRFTPIYAARIGASYAIIVGWLRLIPFTQYRLNRKIISFFGPTPLVKNNFSKIIRLRWRDDVFTETCRNDWRIF